MKRIKLKIPAKINLTLDVCGMQRGYHKINSLVASIDLCDTVTLTKRKDNVINLHERGIPSGSPLEDNTAFKAAKLFMSTFHTTGVDIVVHKRIPVAGGLGGSSADIAGVLIGMNHLYDVHGALAPLANKLGSDANYMLTGGYAVLSGRGEKVKKVRSRKRLYVIVVTSDKGLTAKECYSAYDELDLPEFESTDLAVEMLESGHLTTFFETVKNDLYHAALTKLPFLEETLMHLEKSGAAVSLMSGSGASCYGIYKNKEKQELAMAYLRDYFKKENLFATKTVPGVKIKPM